MDGSRTISSEADGRDSRSTKCVPRRTMAGSFVRSSARKPAGVSVGPRPADLDRSASSKIEAPQGDSDPRRVSSALASGMRSCRHAILSAVGPQSARPFWKMTPSSWRSTPPRNLARATRRIRIRERENPMKSAATANSPARATRIALARRRPRARPSSTRAVLALNARLSRHGRPPWRRMPGRSSQARLLSRGPCDGPFHSTAR